MEKQPMVILTGPTAVGKTNLSIELAKRINGAIISADSMAISAPEPMAIPISATAKAGASLIPSPTMATFLP